MSGAARLSQAQKVALTDLRAFLLNFLDAAVEVVLAQDNLVPEVTSVDFVLMTPRGRSRLATNVDSYADCAFIGAIAGTVLTVTAIADGTLTPGNTMWGPNAADGTVLGKQISGPPGGLGTYNVTPSQTAASGLLACGSASAMQETDFLIQLDVHGPNSADNTQIINTLFRDQAAAAFFAALGHDVSPLYADDGRQMPFSNEEQQIEWRWVIEAHVQVNPSVILGQQFAQSLSIALQSVETIPLT